MNIAQPVDSRCLRRDTFNGSPRQTGREIPVAERDILGHCPDDAPARLTDRPDRRDGNDSPPAITISACSIGDELGSLDTSGKGSPSEGLIQVDPDVDTLAGDVTRLQREASVLVGEVRLRRNAIPAATRIFRFWTNNSIALVTSPPPPEICSWVWKLWMCALGLRRHNSLVRNQVLHKGC